MYEIWIWISLKTCRQGLSCHGLGVALQVLGNGWTWWAYRCLLGSMILWFFSREICCTSYWGAWGKSYLPVGAGSSWSSISFPNWPKPSQSQRNCEWLCLKVGLDPCFKQGTSSKWSSRQAGLQNSFFRSTRNKTRRLKLEWGWMRHFFGKQTQSHVKDFIFFLSWMRTWVNEDLFFGLQEDTGAGLV